MKPIQLIRPISLIGLIGLTCLLLGLALALPTEAAPTLGDAGAKTSLGNNLLGAGYDILNISNLSVGTSTVGDPIHVIGDITATGVVNAEVNAARISAGVFGSLSTKGNYTFQAAGNSNTVLFIDATGEEVGIGTNAPDYELDVAGNIGLNQYLYHNDDTDTYLDFTADSLNVTIGNEGLITLTEDTTQDIVKLGDGGDVDINLNDDVFVQGSSGNVGIATTSPAYTLDVSGSFRVTASGTNAYLDSSGNFVIEL